jgi:hypothetical protein
MSLPRKIFLLSLLVVIAVSYPGGGAHILQIKYLQPARRTPPRTGQCEFKASEALADLFTAIGCPPPTLPVWVTLTADHQSLDGMHFSRMRIQTHNRGVATREN